MSDNPPSPAPPPRKPGRPKTHGVKQGVVFIRGTTALEAFQRAREQGIKYESALTAGVDAVQRDWPGVRFSETDLKRFLAEVAPHDAEEEMVATKIDGNTTIGFRPKQAYKTRRTGDK